MGLDPVEPGDRKAALERRVRLAGATFLASSLAHDLSQPISAINAWAADCRLRAEQDPHVQQQLGERIALLASEAERATRTLRGFSALLPTAGEDMAAVDLGDVLAGLAAVLAEDAAAAGADLHVVDAAGEACRAVTERTRLEVVLYILCRNALEAMHRGATPRPAIVLRPEAAGNRVRIRVEDNGPGVPAAVREALFEPFISGHPHGLGLGLAVCQGTVESIGGQVWLEPQAKAGSTFVIELPREAVKY